MWNAGIIAGKPPARKTQTTLGCLYDVNMADTLLNGSQEADENPPSADSTPRQHWSSTTMMTDHYPFAELVREVLSPGAVGALEQLTPRIREIYGLDTLLDTLLPQGERAAHAESLSSRVKRIVRMLPPDVSAMPNEVFTAIEFLIYEIHGEPVVLGEAILRLEILADEIRTRPLLYDLMMNRAN
jgi:hypothetical protein